MHIFAYLLNNEQQPQPFISYKNHNTFFKAKLCCFSLKNIFESTRSNFKKKLIFTGKKWSVETPQVCNRKQYLNYTSTNFR